MMQNKKTNSALAVCLGILLIGGILQAGGMLKGNRIVFPGLSEIVKAFFSLLSDGKTYLKIGTTLLHVIEALLISGGIGIILGLAEGSSRWFYSFLRPLMVLLRSIPMIVLVVLIMSMISYRAVPVTTVCMILIPVFSEAVYEGCRSIDPELIDVYKMNGGFSFQVAVRVYLPLISGYLKQAWANAAGMGIKVAVTAEYLVQTKDSLGKAVFSSSYFSEYAEIYAYAIIMILLVLLITELPGWITSFFRNREKESVTIR